MVDPGVTRLPAIDAMGLPAALQASPKRYATAVVLSSMVGFVGLQHFYLGRLGEGLLDVGLTLGWIWAFATGHLLPGLVLVVLDATHAFVTTILLLTGNFKDGNGRVVCYPGQQLNHSGR